MKRLFFSLLTLITYISASYALNGKCGPQLVWEMDKTGVLTISGKGFMTDFKGGCPWRPVLVTRVVIKEGVTSIGNNAFKGCRNLTSINIASSVTKIGDKAFKGCKSLSQISIPNRTISIGYQAFAKCRSLTSIDLPNSIDNIGAEAFLGCWSLTSMRVPEEVLSIGSNAFIGCDILNKIVELPQLVTSSTASNYGLNSSLVNEYWTRHNNAKAKPIVENNEGKDDNRQSPKNKNVAAYGSADIDLAIPDAVQVNENTFAVIIANENYSKLAKVPYALNDGKSFAEYCDRTLGLPTENIRYYQDATYGTMIEALDDIKNIDEAFNGEIKVIFYYAGHGAPEEGTDKAYLLPTDAFKPAKGVCLSLSELYSTLGNLKAESVTVFLDACFSGATRDEKMLASTRAVAIEPKEESLSGNMVVLSATTGAETAHPYKDKGHGLFTYFLLKKLQETRGDVSLGELSNYVTEKVKRTSVVIRKKQNPTVISSPTAADSWQSWRF